MNAAKVLSLLAVTLSVSACAQPAKDSASFHWIQGASVVELDRRLQAAGPDSARMEVRLDSANRMTFRIVRAGVTTRSVVADVNDSRICPPICPQ